MQWLILTVIEMKEGAMASKATLAPAAELAAKTGDYERTYVSAEDADMPHWMYSRSVME
jgi:hypothetical protein